MNKHIVAAVLATVLLSNPASAQLEGFATGPVFNDFGPTAKGKVDVEIPEGTTFQIAFDVSEKAQPGKLNRSFESAARFINMHVAAGVPEKDIKITVVVHGGASIDLTNNEMYMSRNHGAENSSAAAIAEMQSHGVEFHLCGQSAAAHKINNVDLLPGVKMSLSAMTSHALLQQQGYTLNPF